MSVCCQSQEGKQIEKKNEKIKRVRMKPCKGSAESAEALLEGLEKVQRTAVNELGGRAVRGARQGTECLGQLGSNRRTIPGWTIEVM